jgi:hypothetical protein
MSNQSSNSLGGPAVATTASGSGALFNALPTLPPQQWTPYPSSSGSSSSRGRGRGQNRGQAWTPYVKQPLEATQGRVQVKKRTRGPHRAHHGPSGNGNFNFNLHQDNDPDVQHRERVSSPSGSQLLSNQANPIGQAQLISVSQTLPAIRELNGEFLREFNSPNHLEQLDQGQNSNGNGNGNGNFNYYQSGLNPHPDQAQTQHMELVSSFGSRHPIQTSADPNGNANQNLVLQTYNNQAQAHPQELNGEFLLKFNSFNPTAQLDQIRALGREQGRRGTSYERRVEIIEFLRQIKIKDPVEAPETKKLSLLCPLPPTTTATTIATISFNSSGSNKNFQAYYVAIAILNIAEHSVEIALSHYRSYNCRPVTYSASSQPQKNSLKPYDDFTVSKSITKCLKNNQKISKFLRKILKSLKKYPQI